MKKIIIFLSLCLCLTCTRVIHAVGGVKVVLNNNVEGISNTTIDPQDVELTFDSDGYEFDTSALSEDDDITDWFVDGIPDGCDYTVTVANITSTTLTATFNGTIEYGTPTSTTPIQVTIPQGYVIFNSVPFTEDIDDVDNTNAKYIIEDTFNIEYKGPYEVAGTVNEELVTNIVEVIITSGDTFASDCVGTNLPTINGMTPTITDLDTSDYKSITITYSGKPLNPSQDLIETIIPYYCLDSYTIDRPVPNREDVKFNITPKHIPSIPETYHIPTTGVN